VAFGIAIGIWVILRILNIIPLGPDTEVFLEYAELIHAGQVPYRDFIVEFPPCSIIVFFIPSIFSTDALVYSIAFACFVMFCIILVEIVLLSSLDITHTTKKLLCGLYVLLSLIYFCEYLQKFDVFPLTLVALSVWLFSKKQYRWSYVLITIAALMKIYPALILGIYLIIHLLAHDETKRLWRALEVIAIALSVLLLSILPFLLCGTTLSELFAWITFHSDRGFQVESTVGILIQFLSDIGIGSYTLVDNHSTFDLNSPIADALLPIWTYITCLGLLIMLILIMVHIRKKGLGEDFQTVINHVSIYGVGIILTFILLNKVFSTQYIVWLLPLVMWMMAKMPESTAKWVSLLMISVYLLSLPRLYFDYSWIFHICYIVRDVLLFALLAYIITILLGKPNAMTGISSRLHALIRRE
jgi:hypothetical protein